MKVTIDGRVLETSGTPTILALARSFGLSIPTLCEHRRLVPFGACRICLVEIGGRRLPVPACATPAENGMVISTKSPKILALRREILDLILSEHPSACLVCLEKASCEEAKSTSRKTNEPTGCILCPVDGRCELQKVAADVGLKGLTHAMTYRGTGVRREDPFIDRDDGLCILCGRCVRVCDEIRGADAISFINRGSRVAVGTSLDKRLVDVGCRFCGACVDVCPTGALIERAVRYDSRFDETRGFVCGLCGQGCRLELRLREGRPVDVRPEDGPPSDGQACVKGRFILGDLISHPKRLTRPMVRRAGALVETTWEEALAATVRGLTDLRGCVEAVLSAQDSCEDLWAMGRFSRAVLAAPSVRLAEDTSVYRAGRVFGSRDAEILAPPITVEEIGKARSIFIFEEALPLTAPIFGVAVNQAVHNGAKLVVVGDAEYCLDRCASLKVKTGPAEAGRFLLALLQVLIENQTSRFRTGASGFEDLRKALRGLKPGSRTDAGIWKIEKIAGLLEKRRPAAFFFGPRFVAGPWGERNAAALWNLAGLTGGFYIPIGWEANSRGAVEIQDALGFPPPDGGLRPGKARGMIMAGSDPAFQRTDEEFVLVMDAFRSDASDRADVVLPRTIFAEQPGTYVNNEGRLQASEAAVAPPGEARPLRSIVEELSRRLGARIIPAENTPEAGKTLSAAIPAFGAAFRSRDENRPALIGGVSFLEKGFIGIANPDAVFDPAAAYPVRDPDDCYSLAAALEIKSLRTARRR